MALSGARRVFLVAVCLGIVAAAAADVVYEYDGKLELDERDVNFFAATATPSHSASQTSTATPTALPRKNQRPYKTANSVALPSILEDVPAATNLGTRLFYVLAQSIEDDDVLEDTGFPAAMLYEMCGQFFDYYALDLSDNFMDEVDEFELFPQLVSDAFDDDLYFEVIGLYDDDDIIFEAVRYGFMFLPYFGVKVTPSTAHGTWFAKELKKTQTPVVAGEYPGWAFIKFQPSTHYHGDVSFEFNAVDTAPYALPSDSQSEVVVLSITVVHVNHPPTRTGGEAITLTAVPYDLSSLPEVAVSGMLTGLVSDADGDAVGIVITKVNKTATSGDFQYFLNGVWNPVPTTVTTKAALALPPNAKLRWVPKLKFYGTASLTAKAWDQTDGTAGGLVNTDAAGSTAFSALRFTIYGTRLGCDSVAGSGKTKDACDVCGGIGATCNGCDGVLGSNKMLDACGECDGNNVCFGCDGVKNSGKKLDDCGVCDGGNALKDCNGDCRGKAVTNKCGVCVLGRTGKALTAGQDCHGDCGGKAIIDSCGVCSNGTTGLVPNANKDCNKVCFGKAAVDSCGVCTDIKEASRKPWIDCQGKCFGTAYRDKCNVCVNGTTGLKPNLNLDACNVCFGNNSTCAGCDGIPNSGKVLDNCKYCGGDNTLCSKIVSISPTVCSTAYAGSIEVIGAGFTSSNAQMRCSFFNKGSSAVTKSAGTYVSAGKVKCTLPAGTVAGDYSLTIFSLNDTYSAESADLSVYDPASAAMTGVASTKLYTNQNNELVVLGRGFVNSPHTVCILDFGTYSGTVLNSTAIKCNIPSVGSPKTVSVNVGPDTAESYNAPQPVQVTFYRRAPLVQSARFADNGIEIRVIVDKQMVNVRGLACSQLFSAATVSMLGSQPTCAVTGNTVTGNTISISLGSGATVVVGSVLTFELASSYTRLDPLTDPLSGPATVLAAFNPQAPTVSLSGPESLGVCDDLVVHYSVTGGTGGRPVTLTWKVDADDGSDTSAIVDYLGLAKEGVVAVGNGNFSFNVQYSITVQATNFLGGKSNAASLTVTKVDSPLPQVSILGGPRRTISAADFLSVKSRSLLPSCVDAAVANITYIWVVDVDGVPLLNAATETVSVDRFQLSGGGVYTFTVEATVNGLGSQVSAFASQEVTVLANPLTVSIIGGSRQTASHVLALTLAASCVDADSATGSCAGAQYQWACSLVTGGPCLSPSNVPLLELGGVDSTAPIVIIPANSLTPDVSYSFSVVVTSDIRSGGASVQVNAVVNKPPVVRIVEQPTRPNIFERSRLRAAVTTTSPITSAGWELLSTSATLDLTDASNLCTVGGVSNFTTLCLEANALLEQTTYTLRYYATNSEGTGFATATFTTNGGPRSGNLVASATSGSVDTSFQLRALDWADIEGDVPLSYSFAYIDSNGAFSPLTERLPEALASVRLPPGVVSVVALVYDARGARTVSNIVNITVTTQDTSGMTPAAFSAYVAQLLASGDGLLAVSAQSEYLTAILATLDVLNKRSIGCVTEVVSTLEQIVRRLDQVMTNTQLTDANIRRVLEVLRRIMSVYGGCLSSGFLRRLEAALKTAVDASISRSQGASGRIDDDTAGSALDAAAKMASANNTSNGTFILDSVTKIGTAYSPNAQSNEGKTVITSSDGAVTIALEARDVDSTDSSSNLTFAGANCASITVKSSVLNSAINAECDAITGNCQTTVAAVTVGFKKNPVKSSAGIGTRDTLFDGYTEASLVTNQKKLDINSTTDTTDVTVCLAKAPTRKKISCQYFDPATNKWSTSGIVSANVTGTTLRCRTKHLSLFGGTETDDSVDPPVGSYQSFVPGLSSIVEGGSFQASVRATIGAFNQSQSCCSFIWETTLTGKNQPWVNITKSPLASRFTQSDGKSGGFATSRLTFAEVFSTFLDYSFRVTIVDGLGTNTSLAPFTFTISASSFALLQARESDVALTKRWSEYWTPPNVNYPAFQRYMVRVASNSSSTRKYFGLQRLDATSFQYKLFSTTGADTFLFLDNNYVTATFDILPTADLQETFLATFKSLVRTAMANAVAHDHSVTIHSHWPEFGSTLPIMFAVRDLNTGLVVPSATVKAALMAAPYNTACGVFDTAILTATYCGVTLTDHTHYTIKTAEDQFVIAAGEEAPYTVGFDAGETLDADNFKWEIESAASVPFSYSESLPFLNADRFYLKSTLGGYLQVGEVLSDTVALFVAAQADATVFVRSSDALYFISAGQTVASWNSPRCPNDLNVADCTLAENNPTYRRLETDLGGEFGVLNVQVAMLNYPLPDTATLAGENLSDRPFGASASLKSRLELWAQRNGSDTWYDLTDSIDDSATRCASSPAAAEAPCTAVFSVLKYSRMTLGMPGNAGWRKLRLVFGEMQPFTTLLHSDDRYFSIQRISVRANCICNGHSKSCNLVNGACYDIDAGTGLPSTVLNCQHNTVGDSCNECRANYYENAGNDVPTDAYNCEDPYGYRTCDGPTLPDITVSEIEARTFQFGKSGLIAADASGMFRTYFNNGGPCIACSCYRHTAFDQGSYDKRACDRHTGQCFCLSETRFVTGNNCEKCVDGYCRNCNATVGSANTTVVTQCREQTCSLCDCNQHSLLKTAGGLDLCNPDGCGCTCDPTHHVKGLSCESCQVGYYSSTGDAINGTMCSECTCHGHKSSFNNECGVLGGDCNEAYDGTPQPCEGNTEGSHCEYCKPGYYRPLKDGSIDLADDCIPCDCNGHGVAKAWAGLKGGVGGGLTATCNPDGGVCNCKTADNVEGDHCEKCKHGYWNAQGDGTSGATCAACVCNGHKAGSSNECEAKGGDCTKDFDGNSQPCEDNTDGHNCELCLGGFYRACHERAGIPGTPCTTAATDGCIACTCNGHQTTNVTRDGTTYPTCNAVGGECTCTAASNSENYFCQDCKPNTWNDVGNAQNGRDCKPCECYGHSSTCSNLGVCSGCADNTENGPKQHCDKCVVNTKRANIANYVNLESDTTQEQMRTESCVACTCNTHENVPGGTTRCDEFTGNCISCKDNTQNGANGECEECTDGHFRGLTGHYVAASDTCRVCDLTGGTACAVHTLTDACLDCNVQCYGPNKGCDKNTGECTDCASSNAEGFRCERCKAGYFGDPVRGIPCQPCLCYHSEATNWAGYPSTIFNSHDYCALHNGIASARECVLDETLLTAALIAQITGGAPEKAYDAIRCNCPKDTTIPSGYFGLANGTKYDGHQCSTCKSAIYYGQPTKCKTPGAGGVTTLSVNGCAAFEECKVCTCYGNIDETFLFEENCKADADGSLNCPGCLGHTAGKQCEKCEDGYYGVATRLDTNGVIGTGFVLAANGTSLKCRKCDCNGQALDRIPATAGIAGDMCETTDSGEWGQYKCRCNEDNGYTGPKCRQCMRGYVLKPGFDANGNPDPDYDYCEPCSSCVVAAFKDYIYPMEASFKSVVDHNKWLNSTTHGQLDNVTDALTALNTLSTSLLGTEIPVFTAALTGATGTANAQIGNVQLAQQGALNGIGAGLTTLEGNIGNLATAVGQAEDMNTGIKGAHDGVRPQLDAKLSSADGELTAADGVLSGITARLTTETNAAKTPVDNKDGEVIAVGPSLDTTVTRVSTGKTNIDGIIDGVVAANVAQLNEAVTSELGADVDAAIAAVDGDRLSLLGRVDTEATRLSGRMDDLRNAQNARLNAQKDHLDDIESDIDDFNKYADDVEATLADPDGKIDEARAGLQTQIDTAKADLDSDAADAKAAISTQFDTVMTTIRTTFARIEDTLVDARYPATSSDSGNFVDVIATGDLYGPGTVLGCGRAGADRAVILTGHGYVNVTGAPAPFGMTITAWVMQQGGDDGYIFAKSTSDDLRYYALLSEGTKDRFSIYYVNSDDAVTHKSAFISLPKPIDDGEWHHVAAIFTHTNVAFLMLYVDGVKIGSVMLNDPIVDAPDLPLLFGARRPLGLPFAGRMEDIRIYDTDLPATAIKLIAGKAPSAPSSVRLDIIGVSETVFDGVSTVMQVPATSVKTVANGLTMYGEVRQTPGNDGYLMIRGNSAGTTRYYGLQLDSKNRRLMFYYLHSKMTAGYSSVNATLATPIDDNQWHSVGIVVLGTKAKFYVDGVVVGTAQLAAPLKSVVTLDPINVGLRATLSGPVFRFKGSMRNVWFANSASCDSAFDTS